MSVELPEGITYIPIHEPPNYNRGRGYYEGDEFIKPNKFHRQYYNESLDYSRFEFLRNSLKQPIVNTCELLQGSGLQTRCTEAKQLVGETFNYDNYEDVCNTLHSNGIDVICKDDILPLPHNGYSMFEGLKFLKAKLTLNSDMNNRYIFSSNEYRNSTIIVVNELEEVIFTKTSSTSFKLTLPKGNYYIYFKSRSFTFMNESDGMLDVLDWGDFPLNLVSIFEGSSNLKISSNKMPVLLDTIVSTSSMFYGSNLEDYNFLDYWQVKTKNMTYFAYNLQADLFNVGFLDVSSCLNFYKSFKYTSGTFSGFDNWQLAKDSSVSHMFIGSSMVVQLAGMDVSKLKNFSYMFAESDFNTDLNSWNVSNAINMSHMFEGANALNCSLSNWDVSNVTTMSYMFSYAQSFSQNLSNWDVSKVEDFSHMFDNSNFNKPINNWNVSGANLSSMFSYADKFNSSLNGWNTSNVTDMSNMFRSATVFNQSIDYWDMSSVTDIQDMFDSAKNFNQPLNSWNLSKVTNITGMFAAAYKFNQPLNNWDMSNIEDMSHMFASAKSFNQSLNDWDVSSVISMESMFSHAYDFNQSLNDWNVSNVTNMEEMFFYASDFNQPLNDWDVSNVYYFSDMMSHSGFNQPINSWNLASAKSLSGMFEYSGFNQPIDEWDVSNVTSMSWMFYHNSNFNQPLSSWNTSNTPLMLHMFERATAMKQDLSGWDVSNVINHEDFSYDSGLTDEQLPDFP